jgi:rfaE bifunctional protein nucleotidyltransferase chain/domain
MGIQNLNTSIFADAEEVREFIAPLRAAGKKIVTTNGCFDIIHAGHVQYLSEAARLGDVLVVGINSDDVVRALKGPDRPVQNEKDRLLVAGALRMVDCAFIFRENDPRAFLEILRPDVHVKGGDYDRNIIEKEVVERYRGSIAIVSYLPGHSTSSLVSKMRKSGEAPHF